MVWTAAAGAQAPVLHLPSPVAVGTTVPPQSISLSVQGTVASIRVVTQGETGLDFKDAGGGTCATQSYPLTTTCTVNVAVSPTAPGHRSGAIVLADSTHHVLASQAIDVTATGPLAVVHAGLTSTAAGISNDWRYRPTDEGQPATSATIYLPQGVVADDAGVFYISDTINARIRKVDTSGNITTFVGIGYPSNNGDKGPSTAAGVNGPTGLALDGAGNLYIADSGNNTVRRVDAVSGIITTVAGQSLASGWTGDGLSATAATLANPNGVAFDADGNLYIADSGNNAIRRVDTSGFISTVVGGPNATGGDGSPAKLAALNAPWTITFGPDGLMYIADLSNHAVRRIDATNHIHTVAGVLGVGGFDGDAGPATAAHLKGPAALALDPAGNLYIADSGNNRIRRVSTTGQIETYIGDGDTSYGPDKQNANIATLYGPYALSLDGKGNFYIADYFHNVIRRTAGNQSLLDYATIRVSKTSDPQQVLIDNDGNTELTPGTFDYDQSALNQATSTCAVAGAKVAVGAQCKLDVEFAPTQISPANDFTYGSVAMHSDAANAPDVITVYGQVLSVEPTQTLLTSSLNPAAVSSNVTFTATVSETQGKTVPTGTVTFMDGTKPLGAPITLNANGIASFSTNTLPLGQHTITASYSGDASNASVVSLPLTESILQDTQISVASSLNPSSVLQDVTFTATLTAGTPVTSGVITFLDGSVAIGTGALTANGTASFTTHALSGGSHLITANFPGDTSSLTSTSPTLLQTVNRASTNTLLSANPSTATVGTGVTLIATVTSNGGPVPTGTVTFKSATTGLGTGTLDANGIASLTTTALPPGANPVTASFGSDPSNVGSTSISTIVTVNRLSTATTLASSTPDANAGSTVQLTASVTLSPGQTAVGTLGGTVTFYDGSTVIGTGSVTNGSAVLSTSSLAVGSHNLSASYGGSTNYNISNSSTIVQVVETSTSTTLLSVNTSSLAGGRALTMTATVNTAGVKATGNVTFADGGTVLGTVALTPGAVATLTVTTLPVGPHNIVATYNGDTYYATSSSTVAPVNVTLGNTVLTLAGSPLSATSGASVTLTASMTSDGVLPSNPRVRLTDNGSALTTLTLTTAGTASFSTSTLSVGTHNIVAQYAGDPNNATAQSQTITITIVAATTTTTLSSSDPSSNFGDTVTLQAKVASDTANLTGSVTFQEGSTNLGTVVISASGVASLPISNFTVAQHNIVAIYSGDSTHSGSTSATLTQSVVDPTAISLSSGTNPAVAGNPVVLTAQVAGAAANSGVTAAPTGTIVFHEGATILGTVALNGAGVASLTTATLSVGSHSIVATYSGDMRYAGNDSGALTETIRNASTQTSLVTSSNPSVYAAPLVLTVHVTGNGGATTGNVNFLDGTTTIGQAALSTSGTAVFTTSTLAPGIHSLTAIYTGDSNNSTSTSAAVNQQVQQATQITLASSSNPALTLEQPTLTASVRTVTGALATGNVRFMDGSVLLGTSALSGGIATLVPSSFTAGTHGITAIYSGDTSDLQAVSTALQLVVNLRSTQNALTATQPSTLAGGVISLISVLKWDGPAPPTGTTTFRTASGVVGTSRVDNTGVATINVQSSAINGKVTASYSGDASYSPSDSAPTDITSVAATNFTLTVTPATFSVVTKQYAVAQITIHSINGFTDTLNLGCLGLPYAATCTFDHDSIKLPADGTVVLKVNIDTGSPLTAGGESSASVHTTRRSSALALLPAGAVLALLAFGRRRRNLPILLLLLLASALLPVMGCGSIDQKSTPAGSYAISVSAVGQGTGVTLSQGLSMTVTQ